MRPEEGEGASREAAGVTEGVTKGPVADITTKKDVSHGGSGSGW